MTGDARIDQLFALLTEWRAYPNYQLERRADIFFALYLQDILRHRYPLNTFDLIVPEFPLRYGSIRTEDQGNGANRSAKVDYVCVDRTHDFCVLLELKTEERSLRKEQFQNMSNAINAGYSSLREGVRDLLEHTQEKRKYTTLLRYLDTALPVKPLSTPHRGTEVPLTGMKMAIIKPTSETAHCPERCDIISFDDVAAAIRNDKGSSDHFTQTFLNALSNWKEPLGR